MPARFASAVLLLSAALLLALPARATVKPFARFEGRVGAEVAAFPARAVSTASGALTLSTIPPGATILFAAIYTNSWFESLQPTATFAEYALPPAPAFDSDGRRQFLYAHRWDVTPYVSGSGRYVVRAGTVRYSYGVALVVVFEHPSLPSRTIVVNDGATSLGEDGASGSFATTFEGVGIGAGEIWVHVQADDSTRTSEEVRMNGTVVAGPLDANLGQNASLEHAAVQTQDGTNVLEIETFGDWFGWHVAVLVAPSPCLAGNVDAAGGGVTDVLFVNDSSGGSDRTIGLLSHEPLSIFVAAPPSATGPTPFALYAWAGLPDGMSALPAGIGSSCMPMPPVGGSPRLKVIWNNVGRFTRLGFPTRPSTPAPSLVYLDSDGPGRSATFFLQGLIVDSASPSGRAAVTNGVTVIVR